MENQKFNFNPTALVLKQHWRQRLKVVRQELSFYRRQQAAAHACLQLSKSCQTAHFVLSFASFGSEIDVWPLNQELAREGRLILSRVIGKELTLFHVTHLSHLEPHEWGMLEPKLAKCAPISSSLIEIAFIPGLGFDLQTKHRLGYGYGYYDQLLASNFGAQTYGIGFSEQAVENLPYTIHDRALHQIHLF